MSYSVVFENVTKKYDKNVVLDQIDLKIEEGKIVGIIAPNGYGKSTIIKMIADLVVPTSGTITICGKKVGSATKEIVSYKPDKMIFDKGEKISDAIKYYIRYFKDFDKTKCDNYLKTFKYDKDAKIGTLSRGRQEILELILTLSRNAKLYLLDEPLANVDPANREAIIKTILTEYKEDATILISTHLLTDIEVILDEVVMIKDNKIKCHKSVEELREETGMSLNDYFKSLYKVDWFGGEE